MDTNGVPAATCQYLCRKIKKAFLYFYHHHKHKQIKKDKRDPFDFCNKSRERDQVLKFPTHLLERECNPDLSGHHLLLSPPSLVIYTYIHITYRGVGNIYTHTYKNYICEMGSVPTWRKAYGALKDQTKVGLAQLNSDFKVSLLVLVLIYILYMLFAFDLVWI